MAIYYGLSPVELVFEFVCQADRQMGDPTNIGAAEAVRFKEICMVLKPEELFCKSVVTIGVEHGGSLAGAPEGHATIDEWILYWKKHVVFLFVIVRTLFLDVHEKLAHLVDQTEFDQVREKYPHVIRDLRVSGLMHHFQMRGQIEKNT